MSEELKPYLVTGKHTNALLPCYKCGGAATHSYYDKFAKGLESLIIDGQIVVEGRVWHFIKCEKCGEQRSGLYPIESKEVINEWNALPRALEWTSEPPKVPGWYWFRNVSKPTILHIKRVPMERRPHPADEWSGPIPEPREPK